MEEDRYKCFNCFVIFPQSEMANDCCPACGEGKLIKKMCENDSGVCTCLNDVKDTISICPKCNEPMCPNDNSHDVVGISRVKSEKIRSY
jgi:hypothetical protein